jgi:tetratricopeptide (TPR) repeat protein
MSTRRFLSLVTALSTALVIVGTTAGTALAAPVPGGASAGSSPAVVAGEPCVVDGNNNFCESTYPVLLVYFIYRDLGSLGGEVEALNKRGTLHRVSGELAQAEGCHRQALELAREIASSWDEAHALAGLGRCTLAAGPTSQAEVLLRQALEIFQRIGAGEAADLVAELDALTGPSAR